MFLFDKGQILCRSYSDGHVSVKFDDQPIKRYACDGASDGSSDIAFLSNESGFLANLKKSKKVIIETEFYQQGNQQFAFAAAGMDWMCWALRFALVGCYLAPFLLPLLGPRHQPPHRTPQNLPGSLATAI